ncbi:MAG: DUF4394 domain-containing protein, partial [Pirellulaceae bacterium]|nr:DUF4394 domain-containing protein [Pirellulaceae bacterium]
LSQTWLVDAAAGSVTIDDAPAVGTDALITFTANTESLEVFGLEGNDAFTVTPGASTVFVDGGDPIGVPNGDSILVVGAFAYVAGPEVDEGGALSGSATVSWDHIEQVSITPDPDCPFLILGTNADDDITIIARDDSYNPGANGVRDFTFSVNAGPDILILNLPDSPGQADLYIDALSGDDDIVIRAPAPNDADWDVHVQVVGGAPSIGEANEADRLVFETPGIDSLVYTPTGADTGTLLIDEDGTLTYTEAGTDSLITIAPFTYVCDDFTYVSSAGGVELVEYDGEDQNAAATTITNSDDTILIVGNAADSTTTVAPKDLGTGSFVSSLSPLFNFRSFQEVTVNGGGGFDEVVLNATNGPDTLTSDTDTVTLAGSLVNLVTVGTSIENLTINTFGGNDSVTLTTFTATTTTIFAGDGNDTVFGSTLADLIYGGSGNDRLIGGGANDTIYGEDGDDTFGDATFVLGNTVVTPVGPNGAADDAGNDQWFGGAGSDVFVWENGDGSDTIEGGTGESDLLTFFSGAAADVFTLSAVGTRLLLNRAGGPINMDMASVEQVNVQAAGGGDSVVVNDLFATELKVLNLDLGAADGALDNVYVSGRNVSDTVNVSAIPGVAITGLKYDINIANSAAANSDRLTLLGRGGNDVLKANDGVEGQILVTIDGGAGNDFVSGDAVLIGGDGDDTVIGGVGQDFVIGDDPYVGLTTANALVRFIASTTTTLLANTPITGLQAGETLVGIDYRPATGQLYGMGVTGGNTGRLYVIDVGTGAAVQVGAPFALPQSAGVAAGGVYGFDFNPTVDRIRVVSSLGDNFRLNPDTGAIAGADTALTAGSTVVGSAYDRNFAGATVSTLFGIDSATGNLVRQGGVDGAPSPNLGAITPIGSLGVATTGNVGFDIAPGTNNAFATLTVAGVAGLYSINLSTGAATLIGNVGPGGTAILGFAISAAAGNDFLSGNAGADFLDGGPLEDTMVGGLGLDTYDGGTGFDTILVQGTSNNDRIDAIQNSPTSLQYEVSDTLLGYDGVVGGPGTETDTLVVFPVAGTPTTATVENVKIESGSGDDILRVTQSDSLIVNSFQALSLRFTVDAGAPAASDRLTVVDDGLGDTVIQRVGATPGTGSYQIGGMAPIVYFDVEYASLSPLNPITGGTGTNGLGRLFVFKADPYESNNSLPNATFLGSNSAINVDPTIDPGFDATFNSAGDEDWYRVVAQYTGDLDIRVFFSQYAGYTDVNGLVRPGLPGNGNLDIAVYDINGLTTAFPAGGAIAGVGTFGSNESAAADADERVRIPAVAGQTYYLRVRGAPAGGPLTNANGATASDSLAVNVYNISVINTPVATPYDGELDDIIATSTVTAAASATQFNGGAALSAVDDFYNGKDVYFTSGPLNGQRGRVSDYVGATRTFTFVAGTFTGISAVGNAFQIETFDTGRSQLDNVTRDNTPIVRFRVDDAWLLQDVPGNPTPGNQLDPGQGIISIPFSGNAAAQRETTSLTGINAGFRVAIFDEGTPQQPGQLPQVPVGYARQIAEGVYEFDFERDRIVGGAVVPFALTDGSHFLSARVQIVDPSDPNGGGFGNRSLSLEIVVDTQSPPIFFGLPNVANDGLHPDSDSGIGFNQPTLVDRVTNATTPKFFGQAEANSVVRLYVDMNGNGTVEPATDIQIAVTTAIPLDGTNQYPTGYWEATSNVDLNGPQFPLDGLRTILATAEDVAGNINALSPLDVTDLQIFLDTRGPQVTDVDINNAGNPYDLFDPKPSTDGPTPLVNSLVISFQDLPARVVPFLYTALKQEIAETPGIYQVRGDYNGIIPILDVNVLTNTVGPGIATATVELVFRLPGADGVFNTSDDIGAALPDDRFTLTILDELQDYVGNKLDGESNSSEPQENPLFPTGDQVPGGNYVARFTIDTRPEVGVYAAGSAWIDINGNTTFDPDNPDYTNRDITYIYGYTSDNLFSGNFAGAGPDGVLGTADDRAAAAGNGVADGFDKLGAYGRVGTATWRWLIDTDNDGVSDIERIDPASINGKPIAGNFDGFDVNGDEVGLFTGSAFWFDTNHDYRVDATVSWPTVGQAIVGDFDGDGNDDLGTYTDDVWSFDLSTIGATSIASLPGISGTVERTFKFGFIGVGEVPVAADMNVDGIEDIGLWVPARSGVDPTEQAEWYFLVSGVVQNDTPGGPAGNIGPSITGGNYPVAADGPGDYLAPGLYGVGSYANGRIVTDPLFPNFNIVRFQPVPFGNDQYLQYGDEFALPLLGNFDPPVTSSSSVIQNPSTNNRVGADVNNDGIVNAQDILAIISFMSEHGGPAAAPTGDEAVGGLFYDVDNSGFVNVQDILGIINYMAEHYTPPSDVPTGEGE